MVALFGFCGGFAEACSCVPPPACGLIPSSHIVFVGKVLALDWIDHIEGVGKETHKTSQLIARIRVEESFYGKQRIGDELSVDEGDLCGYPFRIGDSYLVDADFWKGQLTTSLCTGTGEVEERTRMIRALRTATAGGRLDDLEGRLRPMAGAGSEEAPTALLSGVKIQFTPTTGGEPFHATTDSDGEFRLSEMPAGKYVATTDLPKNLAIGGMNHSALIEKNAIVEVSGSHGAACYYEMWISPSGSVQGSIVDQAGKPRGGDGIYPMLVNAHMDSVGSPKVGEDGSFSFSFVAAGAYYLRAFVGEDYKNPWFYPGVQVPGAAKQIVVGEGEEVRGIRFVIPSSPQKN
jgi:hypothetical protein